jgi:hypothetical protein
MGSLAFATTYEESFPLPHIAHKCRSKWSVACCLHQKCYLLLKNKMLDVRKSYRQSNPRTGTTVRTNRRRTRIWVTRGRRTRAASPSVVKHTTTCSGHAMGVTCYRPQQTAIIVQNGYVYLTTLSMQLDTNISELGGRDIQGTSHAVIWITPTAGTKWEILRKFH